MPEAAPGTRDGAPASSARIPPAPIALIGLRGSGKTTVGRRLAQLLGRRALDLDEEVLRWAGHCGQAAADAGSLLEAVGEPRFRALEAAALRSVLEASPRIVLATGGGVVERPDNRAWLRRVARTVWLDVPLELLRARVAGDPTYRPALTGGDLAAEPARLLARREPWYRSLADHVVAAGEGTPEEVARRILAALESRAT